MIELNKDRLKTMTKGMVFNSYNELCDYLGESIKKGNSRKSQLKEWGRYFRFTTRKNNSIAIQEVYENPLQKKDKRFKGNKSIYTPLIELILLDYISKNYNIKNNYICVTKKNLGKILGFYNDNYIKQFYTKYNIDKDYIEKFQKFVSDNSVTGFDIQNFKFRTSTKFSQVLESAFKQLQNKAIAKVDIVYMIVESDFENKVKPPRIATDNEVTQILQAQRETLTEMKLNSMTDAMLMGLGDDFYDSVTVKLNQRFGWVMCYSSVRFMFTEVTLKQGMEVLQREMKQIMQSQKELNNLLKEYIDNQAETLFDKTNKTDEEIFNDLLNDIQNDKTFQYHTSYVENQEMLSNFFLKLNNEDKK